MIPQLRDWHAKYEQEGLTIVGRPHARSSPGRSPTDKVVAAARDLGVRYPIVQDNDHAIWRRFQTWAWPTAVLVDRKGVVRYTHIGEGAYAETERMIQPAPRRER